MCLTGKLYGVFLMPMELLVSDDPFYSLSIHLSNYRGCRMLSEMRVSVHRNHSKEKKGAEFQAKLLFFSSSGS